MQGAENPSVVRRDDGSIARSRITFAARPGAISRRTVAGCATSRLSLLRGSLSPPAVVTPSMRQQRQPRRPMAIIRRPQSNR